MKIFSKNVNKRSKKEMIDFLAGHFRYDTMYSWNRQTSYAHNVKVYMLGLPAELEDRFSAAAETNEFWSVVQNRQSAFCRKHEGRWQIGFNGRSGGYVVLYSGSRKPSEFKSICTVCGQKNFRTVEETGCRCGYCGAEARVNIPGVVYDYYVHFTSVDSCYPEDYEDWTAEQLRDRVAIVQEFDQWCDDLLAELVNFVNANEVVEETVMVPTTRRVMRAKEAKA